MHKNITGLIFSLALVFLIIGVFYNISKIDINKISKNQNKNKVESGKVIESLILEDYSNTLKINENKFLIEKVEGKEKTQMGLSDRVSMCAECGMLFIFEEESNYAFWMKDMNYDLDIIFINADKKIVNIFSDVKKEGYNKVEPNKSEKIRNTEKAKYVLELNAGVVKYKNIKVGDVMDF